ncbi:MAG: hypothetical protein K2W95_18210 [Candidatus Obscuribacterales bacterium]|nr:hypothetical protein [Candidatus Obscuribacterales bacterium]
MLNREHHKWHSPRLDREMELLVFGHHGARVIVFPTSMGRFFDWESRGMMDTLGEHLERGWVQVYCVDSVDSESWYDKGKHPGDRARRHLAYQDYIVNEVVPFSQSKNDNPFLMSMGASFGAYHAIDIALKHAPLFNRAIGMSGLYDIRNFADGFYDEAVHRSNPVEYVRSLDNQDHINCMKQVDFIIAIGAEDPSFGSNKGLSDALWSKDIWHAFRIWDGFAHDWPVWHDMMLHYIGGPDSR